MKRMQGGDSKAGKVARESEEEKIFFQEKKRDE